MLSGRFFIYFSVVDAEIVNTENVYYLIDTEILLENEAPALSCVMTVKRYCDLVLLLNTTADMS